MSLLSQFRTLITIHFVPAAYERQIEMGHVSYRIQPRPDLQQAGHRVIPWQKQTQGCLIFLPSLSGSSGDSGVENSCARGLCKTDVPTSEPHETIPRALVVQGAGIPVAGDCNTLQSWISSALP